MHRQHHAANDDGTDGGDGAGGDGAAAGGGGPGGDADPNRSYIHADLAHVGEYDAALLRQLLRRPGEALPAMEAAAADALRTLLYAADRGADAEAGRDALDDDADGDANAGAGADRTPRQMVRGASVLLANS